MLRLGKQVRGNEAGIASAICQNEDFRRPCDHVDVHQAIYLPLCLGNIDVARTDDLVHPGNALRAIGERRNSLRTADAEHAAYARNSCCCKDFRRKFAAFRGGYHDYCRHTSKLCRDAVHQHSGRVACRSARHIEAHAGKGCNFLAEHDAIPLAEHKPFAYLALVKCADIFGSLLQNCKEVRLHRIARGSKLIGGYFKRRVFRHAIESSAIAP